MEKRAEDRAISIYEELKAAGVEIDHHESDLFVPVNAITIPIVDRFDPDRATVTTFNSRIDGKLWYDIPFQYAPFWERKPCWASDLND